MNNINKKIKELRISRRLSQEEMASDLKVSINYISLIENNKKKPGNAFLNKFSEKYKIPLLLLNRDSLIPKAKTPKEKILQDRIVELFDDLEKLFLNNGKISKTS